MKVRSVSIKTDVIAITLLLFFFSFTGTALTLGYAHWNGISLTAINEVFDTVNPVDARRFFLVMATIHQVFTFLLPCLFFWILFKRKTDPDFFQLGHAPTTKSFIISFLLLILSMPLVQISFYLNGLLPLPEWAHSAEDTAADMINGLLAVDTISSLLLNLLVVSLIPAVGEELFFRGIVQKKLVQYFQNPHFAIWLGAFFFSAFHFQLEGLFPRMVLGGVLGYIYYWTHNLWITIMLHLFNNATIVVGAYIDREDISSAVSTDLSPTVIGMAIAGIFLGSILIRHREKWAVDHNRLEAD